MGYSIKISKSVQKQIVDLPNGMKGRILEKIKGIESPQQPHYLVARETLATHFQRFYLLFDTPGPKGVRILELITALSGFPYLGLTRLCLNRTY